MTTDRSRIRRLWAGVLIYGGGIPLVLLAGLYAGSRLAAIEFGTVVFVLTGLTALAWILFAGWGQRMDAARPTGELFRRSATDYGSEHGRGRYPRLPLPTRVLFVVTGTVLLGWVSLLATL